MSSDVHPNAHSEFHDMSRQLAQYMEARITAASVRPTYNQMKQLRTELLQTADRVLTPTRRVDVAVTSDG